jgi:hypothetical protein
MSNDQPEVCLHKKFSSAAVFEINSLERNVEESAYSQQCPFFLSLPASQVVILLTPAIFYLVSLQL